MGWVNVRSVSVGDVVRVRSSDPPTLLTVEMVAGDDDFVFLAGPVSGDPMVLGVGFPGGDDVWLVEDSEGE